VVGYGNTSAAEHSVPALTAVSMPSHQLGVEAMQAVVDALALEQPRVFPRRLPYHLVIRESSGPPARAVPGKIARRSRNPTVARVKVES
jgi:DNA-binding LacI/PurR family transcriptional regulator